MKSVCWRVLLLVLVVAGAACSNQDKVESAKGAQPAAASAPVPEVPGTLTDVNVAAADMGGAVEELHENYGPGLTGRRLIDGLLDQTWLTPAGWYGYWMYNKTGWAKCPVDAVLSFYERQPALVAAVVIVVPDAMSVKLEGDVSTAPQDVEIWTSMDNAPEQYVKAAAATLETTPGEHTITFPAREARFVKLHILSGASQRVLELAEVRVLEAVRAGYVPLFTRAPGAALWKGSPREAAQRGLEWLQQAGNDWTTQHGCFGCHVQAQALMGQAVALKHRYRVSMPAVRAFADLIHGKETPEGTWVAGSDLPASVFGAMGLAYAAEMTGKASDPQLLKAVDYVLGKL